MRGISTLAAVLLAASAIGIAAAPVAGAADTVKPKLECVFKVPDKDGTYVSVWGYENTGTAPVEIPIGTNNRFDPTPEGRGQPTRFAAGRQTNVFTVTWDGTNLTWRINGAGVTGSRNSKECDEPPVPQGSDSPQAVALIAAAAGVIVIGGATSGWMVRRRRHRAV
jgi:hypothetical protein